MGTETRNDAIYVGMGYNNRRLTGFASSRGHMYYDQREEKPGCAELVLIRVVLGLIAPIIGLMLAVILILLGILYLLSKPENAIYALIGLAIVVVLSWFLYRRYSRRARF